MQNQINMQHKLTIELVPKTMWYTNVRSNVSKSEWDRIRLKCYIQANNQCEICGDVGTNQGVRHKVECHEIWEYDDANHVQKLTGLIALCPNCHTVKHPGLAQINGKLNVVINQLKKVNNMTFEQAAEYLADSFTVWRVRSQHQWSLDTSFLDTY